jgi:acyl-coenzyme A synthetase/AMP-(fatty) acid ligase
MTLELYKDWGASKFGSVGRALPGVQLRITGPDTGKPLAPGEEGILEVISPRMGPEWIRTADIAVLDAEGFLFHRGRADGAILRGGFKLLPEAIERPLLLHPAIIAAVVVGIADHRLGQVPVAAIMLKNGFKAPSNEDLEAHLRAHLPATHIPTAWRIIDELPRTPSMKVDLQAVRHLFAISNDGHVR